MANQTSKDREDYLKTRRTYLQGRISQLQDSLRKAGLSSERKKSLQDKLKNFKDNLLKIKSTSNLKDIDMAKQSLSAQYKKSITASTRGTAKSPSKLGQIRSQETSAKRDDSYGGPRDDSERRSVLKDNHSYGGPRDDSERAPTKPNKLEVLQRKIDRLKNEMRKDPSKRAEWEQARKDKIAETERQKKLEENGVKKATPKPNLKSDKSDKDTTVKVTRTNTKKPIGGRITSLKHNAKQLTLQTNISGKRMLRNAISDLYEAMTVAERKKFDITQYVSGQDLKAMSKSSDKIKDVVDNHKTEFLKPTEVKNNFAKDQKVIDSRNRKFKEEQKRRANDSSAPTPKKDPAKISPKSKRDPEKNPINIARKREVLHLTKLINGLKKRIDKEGDAEDIKYLKELTKKRNSVQQILKRQGISVEITPKITPKGGENEKGTQKRNINSTPDNDSFSKPKPPKASNKGIKNLKERLAEEKKTYVSNKDGGSDPKTGKRYTKRGVTQMLKQLREQQESGRKTSNAYKQREEDIKRLTKVLKTLSSVNPTIGLADQHRIAVIANSLEVVTANTVWGTGATYDELAKALKKLGIKGVTADGLEGDFDEGDGVTSGSEPVYKYFDKVLGEDDSQELAEADGAFVFATLYIAGLLGKNELKTVVPNANIRKLILKCTAGLKTTATVASSLGLGGKPLNSSKHVQVASSSKYVLSQISRILKLKIKRGETPVLVIKTPIKESTLERLGKTLISSGEFTKQMKDLLVKESESDYAIYLSWVDEDDEDEEYLISINNVGEISIT